MARSISPSRQPSRLSKWGIMLGIAASLITIEPSFGQSTQISVLNQSLQQAVAQQNWDSAIRVIDEMILIAPEKRQSLELYRSQLSDLQSKSSPQLLKTTPTRPPGSVPIKRRDNGVVIIDTLFNNRPFEMLLDSGASLTVITRSMARSLGIRPEHFIEVGTFKTANGTTQMPIVSIRNLTVGRLVARDVVVAIAGPDMDIGLLGQDFLQRYDVTIRRDSVEFDRR